MDAEAGRPVPGGDRRMTSEDFATIACLAFAATVWLGLIGVISGHDNFTLAALCFGVASIVAGFMTVQEVDRGEGAE